MKSLKNLYLLLIAMILLPSCTKKIYCTKDAYSLAGNHQIIAIMPPEVSIEARKNVQAETIIEQQKTESLVFQKEMFIWMCHRRMEGRIPCDIQDIGTTNSKLQKVEYHKNNYSALELGEILEVDGIILSNYYLSKPVSEGGAIALAVIGVIASTNSVAVVLDIKDCETNKIIWTFDNSYSGGIGSKPVDVVDYIMKKASKEMPYIIDK